MLHAVRLFSNRSQMTSKRSLLAAVFCVGPILPPQGGRKSGKRAAKTLTLTLTLKAAKEKKAATKKSR